MDRRWVRSKDTDLTQLEGDPSNRADVLIEPQGISKAEVKIWKLLHLKLSSQTSSGSPAGVSIGILHVTIAAVLAAAIIGGIGGLTHASGDVITICASVLFVIVFGAGLHVMARLTKRVESSPGLRGSDSTSQGGHPSGRRAPHGRSRGHRARRRRRA